MRLSSGEAPAAAGGNMRNENGEWRLAANRTFTMKVRGTFSATEYTYDQLVYRFLLTRKPRFYMLNIIFPCLLLSIVACFVFLVPRRSGERLSMAVTVLLSFTVFQLVVADIMPRDSDSNPLLAIYMTICTVSSGVLLCLGILISRITSTSGRSWQTSRMRRIFGFFKLFLTKPGRTRHGKCEGTAVHSEAEVSSATAKKVAWQEVEVEVKETEKGERERGERERNEAARKVDISFFCMSVLVTIFNNIYFLVIFPCDAESIARKKFLRPDV